MSTTSIILFGRFQPPTIGHERLFQFAQRRAVEERADFVVFLSQTQDTKDNPLSFDEKAALLTVGVPRIQIGPTDVKTPYDALFWAKSNQYRKIIFLVGDDRRLSFERMIQRWQEKEDPDGTMTIAIEDIPRSGAMDMSKISGSVMRNLARRDKYASFKAIFLSRTPEPMVRKTFQAIRDRLGPMTEHAMFTRFADYVRQLFEYDYPEASLVEDISGNNQNVTPDEDMVSADELSHKLYTQRGSIDRRESERVPSDRPENKSKLALHPLPRLKSELAKRFDQQRNSR